MKKIFLRLAAVLVSIPLLIYGIKLGGKMIKYHSGISAISSGDYAEAIYIFKGLDGFKNSEVLFKYAHLQSFLLNDSKVMANSELSEIPEVYHGEYSKEIAELRKTLPEEASVQQKEIDKETEEFYKKLEEAKSQPTASPTNKPYKRYFHSGSSSNNADEYNVYDYDDYEDFYEDNAEDFDGLEDAETYYDEAYDE